VCNATHAYIRARLQVLEKCGPLISWIDVKVASNIRMQWVGHKRLLHLSLTAAVDRFKTASASDGYWAVKGRMTGTSAMSSSR
jgi:hypothetical protein